MIQIKPIKIAFYVLLASLTTACNTAKQNRDFLYFQRGLDSVANIQVKENIIKVNDVLNIIVSSSSRNQEQAAAFNVPAGTNSPTTGYQVNSTGSIDIPVIGLVKAAGLTKLQLQTLLAERISPYVKDPLVLVRFVQFNVNVLGEVRAPGTKTFQTDRVTIVDAISVSGDMTEFGKKEDVMVIREETDKRRYYKVDMRSGSLFQSPVYLLQPNDIVYVGANHIKLKNVNVDPQRLSNMRYYLTFLSVATTIISVIIAISR
jgi:polysaccharide export outer membrane protein